MEKILKRSASLYIDVTCYGCKRNVALSNTKKIYGRDFCYRCYDVRSNTDYFDPIPGPPKGK